MPPEIDYEKCTGCGKCIDVCPEDVFFGSNREKPVVAYPEICWHCNWCVKECPVKGAIWLRIPLAMSVCYK